ncbi:aminopeptidase, partial [bacterium]
MFDPRLGKLAHVLVNYSARVKRGQLVRLSSPTVATPLVAALTREVLRAGGHPTLRLSFEEFDEICLAEASEEQLRYVNP